VARGACRSINHIADVRTREVAEFEALKRANPHGNIRPPRRGDHAKLLAKDGADGIGLKKATPKPRRRLYGAEALALGHGVKLGAVPELLHDDPLIEVRVRCLRACCVCICVWELESSGETRVVAASVCVGAVCRSPHCTPRAASWCWRQ
jgi:hypothetical protein